MRDDELAEEQLADFQELLRVVSAWEKQDGYFLFQPKPIYEKEGKDAIFDIAYAISDAVKLGYLESRDSTKQNLPIIHNTGQFSVEAFTQLRPTPKGMTLLSRKLSLNGPDVTALVFMWMPNIETASANVVDQQKNYLNVVKDIVKVASGGKWKAERIDDDYRQDDYIIEKVERKAQDSRIVIADLAGARGAVLTEIGIVRGLMAGGQDKQLYITVPKNDLNATEAVQENIYLRNLTYHEYSDVDDLRGQIGPMIRRFFENSLSQALHVGATYPFLRNQVIASATASTVGIGSEGRASYHQGPNCD